jgi:hypothetical protein
LNIALTTSEYSDSIDDYETSGSAINLLKDAPMLEDLSIDWYSGRPNMRHSVLDLSTWELPFLQLKTLEIRAREDFAFTAVFLKRSPNLQQLRLDLPSKDGDDVSEATDSLVALPHLTYLKISYGRIFDILWFLQWPSLQSLVLDHCDWLVFPTLGSPIPSVFLLRADSITTLDFQNADTGRVAAKDSTRTMIDIIG